MSDYYADYYAYDAVDRADSVSEILAEPYDEGDNLDPCNYCGEMVDFDADDNCKVRNRRIYCSLLCADNSEKGSI